MPANFPEIWLKRVQTKISQSEKADFLDGIDELDVPVTVINEGQVTEQNKIYVPETEFEVDVLINNSAYPIPVQQYSDGTIEITLDKLQTKVVSVSDDKVLGASYKVIDSATKAIVRSLVKTKHKKAAYSIGPAGETADTPILEATGEARPDGRKTLTYEDLVNLKEQLDKLDWPLDGRRLVLQPEHWNDLLRDRKNFGDQLVSYAKGKPMPVVLGFEMTYFPVMPIYNSNKQKKAYGAIKESGDRVGSVAFVIDKIAKKTGFTRQYFLPATQNPRVQANELAYRHYYIVTPYKNKFIAAII